MPKVKLTPAQFAVVMAMAKGANIVESRFCGVSLADAMDGRRLTTPRVTRTQINSLLSKGAITPKPYVVASFETVYTLTDLGRKLAKDGENG